MLGATAGQGRAAIADAVRDGSGAHRRAPPGTRRHPGLPRRPDHGPARPADRRRRRRVLAAELGRLDALAEEPVPGGRPAAVRRRAGDDEPSPLARSAAARCCSSIGGGSPPRWSRCWSASPCSLPATTRHRDRSPQTSAGTGPSAAPRATSSPARSSRSPSAPTRSAIVDPPGGDRARARDTEKVIDGDTDERLGHRTSTSRPKFGNVKARHGGLASTSASRAWSSRSQAELSAAGRLRRALRRHASTRPPPPPGTRSWSRATARRRSAPFERARRHHDDVQRLRPGPEVPLPAALVHRAAGQHRGRLPDRRTGDHVQGSVIPPPAPGTARSGAWIDRRGRSGRDRSGGRRRPSDGAGRTVGTTLTLLRAHVAGDPDAFAELWSTGTATGSGRWRCARIGDREEAADALQDALLSAHRAAARFRGDSAVTTWLHRIVVNACLDRIRRRQAHPTVPLPRQRGRGRRTRRGEPAAPGRTTTPRCVVRQALAELAAGAAGRVGPGRRAGLPGGRGGPDPRRRRGDGQEPVRPRPGPARRALGHLRVRPAAQPSVTDHPTARPTVTDHPAARPRSPTAPAGTASAPTAVEPAAEQHTQERSREAR